MIPSADHDPIRPEDLRALFARAQSLPRSCAAFLRAAAVAALGHQSPSTRDAEALLGLQNAAAAGMDLEAYTGLIAGHVTRRGQDLIVRWILAHRTDSIRGALRALEVIRA